MRPEFATLLASATVGTLLTAAIIAGLSLVNRRARPAAVSGHSEIIAPEKVSAWITVIVGELLVLAGVLDIFHSGGGVRLALTFSGTAIAGFMAPSLTSLHAVSWTEVSDRRACPDIRPNTRLGAERDSLV